VARNMWYTWKDARINRDERGNNGKPNRRVRDGAEKACECVSGLHIVGRSSHILKTCLAHICIVVFTEDV